MSEKLDWVKALEEMADLQHYYATGEDWTGDEIDAWEKAGGLDIGLEKSLRVERNFLSA